MLVMSLVLLAALRLVDRSTRVRPEAPVRFDLGVALDRCAEAVSRDFLYAGAGGLPAGEGLRARRDNTPGLDSYPEASGDPVFVRLGTDQVSLRGILRSPILTLDAVERSSGRPFSASVDTGSPGEIQRSPGGAVLRIYVYPLLRNPRRTWIVSSAFPGAEGRAWLAAGSPAVPGAVAGVANEELEAVAARLSAAASLERAKRFFLVADGEGRFAVARILSVDDRALASGCTCAAPSEAPGDCPPGASGCFLALKLDFTDVDAVAFNRGASADAPFALGPLASGGLFDEIVYFVARGRAGRPPDYVSVNDPPSSAYPHPYLAAARSIGGGRFEISRVAEDIEEFQVAWGIAAGSVTTWQAERPGSPPPRPDEFGDSLGHPMLKAVKIAVVAKSATRRRSGAGSDVAGPPVLNAPLPDPAGRTGPVGWSLDPGRRVSYERETRVLTVVLRNYAGETVR